MRIVDIDAVWLHCPIPYERQHVSDYGRIASFDATLISVTTEDGRTGYGEAKAAVGSAGGCAAIVAYVKQDLRPMLVGQDADRINLLWERMYNGPRDHYAVARGRPFPILGRRGLSVEICMRLRWWRWWRWWLGARVAGPTLVALAPVFLRV